MNIFLITLHCANQGLHHCSSLLKRLSLKPEIGKHYDDVIWQQLEQGIIEQAEQGVNRGVRRSIAFRLTMKWSVMTSKQLLFMMQVLEQEKTCQV